LIEDERMRRYLRAALSHDYRPEATTSREGLAQATGQPTIPPRSRPPGWRRDRPARRIRSGRDPDHRTGARQEQDSGALDAGADDPHEAVRHDELLARL
jgi:hypothetical protein